MNTNLCVAAESSEFLRFSTLTHNSRSGPPKRRVAVFGSFCGGYHVLRELLGPALKDQVEIVGVATDDPTQPFTHPTVRLWKYPHEIEDELLVRRFAQRQGLPVYAGRVTSESFIETFEGEWNPDLCLMATFGQKIPNRLIKHPSLGFYNFHHCDTVWPSYPGPDPIAQMVRDGKKHLALTMHVVTDVIDGGEFVARSQLIQIPENVNAISMHRISWPQMGPFIRAQVRAIVQRPAVLIH